ncbi:MAG: Bax inhibitor-1/YccA family protein [Elusimicrobia bacterium]|nr:Bax inhibitor-1/YccA family protein [Elusimicrobiota bacterium]
MRSANPALSDKTFTGFETVQRTDVMTVDGCVNKTAVLLGLVSISAVYTWNIYTDTKSLAAVTPYLWTGAIGGFVMALITIFNQRLAGITSPIYALLEGLVLGGISAVTEARFPGIVMQAVCLTFGTLFCLLMAYKSGLIKATENFKLGIVAATGAVALVYLAGFILGFFGIEIPYIHGSGIIGIGFSLFVVAIAALNLVLDFDFIEKGAESGAPKYMEWYGAFGLMVTLVWLYLEILRLLAKSRSRK